MPSVKRFTINNSRAELTITFSDNSEARLTFEYLRVFAPTNGKGQATGLSPEVFHKKLVQLSTLEIAGKHGYRLCFDDGHSDIYHPDYLTILANEYQQRWQHYLATINTTSNSREATIQIKEL